MNMEIHSEILPKTICMAGLFLTGDRNAMIHVTCMKPEGHDGPHQWCKKVSVGTEATFYESVEVEVEWQRSTIAEKRIYREQIQVGAKWTPVEKDADEVSLAGESDAAGVGDEESA